MAEKRDSHGEEPFPRKNEPHLSHAIDDDIGPININSGAPVADEVVKKHQEPSWLKKNTNVLILAAAGAVSLALLVVLGSLLGWFGSGSKAKPSAGTVAQSSPTPPAAASPSAKPASQPAQPAPGQQVPSVQPATVQPATPPGQPAPKPSQPAPAPPAPGQEAKKEQPKKPPLPDDFAQWKKDDYFRARKENDPKLLPAVAYLGQNFPGRETIAQGLTNLLKPLPPEKPSAEAPPAPGSAQPRNPAEFTKLVEAIVEALGSNGSPPARDTLERILAGKFATDDDKAAVEAAVKTLAAHPCDENDGLLFRLLTDAEALRPSDRAGPWPAKDLQAKALELVKPAASIGLRTKLATWLVGRPGGLDEKEPICAFILTADPRNCGGQMIFYKRDDTHRDIKETLENHFLEYNLKALARQLGIPDEAASGSSPGGIPAGQPAGLAPAVGGGNPGQPTAQAAKPAEVDPTAHVVEQLWSSGFLALLEPQLGRSSMEEQKHLLLLAATIPHESTRAILTKMLNKRWDEGPKIWESVGLLDHVIDPGLLVSIKLKLGGVRKDKSPAGGAPGVGAGRRPNAKGADATKKQQVKQEWMETSSKLVDAWRKRLFAAAQAKEKAEKSDERAGGAAAPKLPEGFRMSPGANVKAAYHLSWPDDAPPEIAKLDTGLLDVYYIRAEESNQIEKLKTFYTGQAKVQRSDARLMDKSVWIDSMRTAVEKDRRRSLDVLITRTSGVTANALENKEEADFLIEVLIVEIKAPPKE